MELLESLKAIERNMRTHPVPSTPKMLESPRSIVVLTGMEALIAAHRGEVVAITRRTLREIIEALEATP